MLARLSQANHRPFGNRQQFPADNPPQQTTEGTGYDHHQYPSVPGAAFVLTNNDSEAAQIAAIKLVDYMFTQEGQLRAYYGEEGVDWRRPKEGDVALNKEVDPIWAVIQQPEGSEPRNSAWGAMAQYFQPKTFRDAWVQSTDPAGYYNWPGYERRLQAVRFTKGGWL